MQGGRAAMEAPSSNVTVVRTSPWCVQHQVHTARGVAMDGHLTVSYVSRVAVSWLRFTLAADLSSYIIYTSAYEATGERRDA